MIDIYKIMSRAAVLTVAWILFAFSLFHFAGDRPPSANIVSAGTIEVNGKTVEIPQPDAAEFQRADSSLPFLTAKTFQQEMDKHRRTHVYHGVLTAIFALAVFIFGVQLGGYAYGIACLLFGPLAVAYMTYRSSRLI